MPKRAEIGEKEDGNMKNYYQVGGDIDDEPGVSDCSLLNCFYLVLIMSSK
jgi:hypothetical protein